MKSAYELAMERFGGPEKKLSDDQKARIAEIDQRCKAKIAELEIMRQAAIDAAEDDPEKQGKLMRQKQHDIRELESKAERDKDAIRNE